MSKDKFKNQFRTQSIRLPGYDYRRPGKYFVTICVKGREQIMGSVVDNEMILSPAGKIADACWIKIGALHDYILLDEYVIMPDHVHGIIEIRDRPGPNSIVDTLHCNVSTMGNDLKHANDLNDASDLHESRNPDDANNMQASLVNPEPEGIKYFSNISPKPKSLSTLIRSFKGACTKEINKKLEIKMEWQERFYDRWIRSRDELEAIQWYIRKNPRNWAKIKHLSDR